MVRAGIGTVSKSILSRVFLIISKPALIFLIPASFPGHSFLGFSYSGNRMTGAVDVVNQHSFSFGYDADGNRTADGRTGLECSSKVRDILSYNKTTLKVE